ncbi:hypothetical protein BX616_003713, partial [Lobosporangium transversale]
RKALDASNSGKDGEDDSEEKEGGNEEKGKDDQVDIPTDHEFDFEGAYTVEYEYQHNLRLDSLTDLGTRQLSGAVKAAIECLLLKGSTIQTVLHELTMDYGKFTQV